MPVPKLNLDPPFNVTRASHVILNVRDLPASRAFYTEAVGLEVSDEDGDSIYLRGMEEASHHSLVLKRTTGEPSCERLGLRVYTEEDLDKAEAWFRRRHVAVAPAEVAFQGRTLHVTDPFGIPLEICASMDAVPRLMHDYKRYRGGAAQRIDHFQIATDDVQAACDFYVDMGFRLSEYAARDGTDEMWGAFLQRKGNPHDVVFTNGRGPRLHHFAYTIRDAHDLIHYCDTLGSLGWGERIDRGPGRHGMGGGALFVYTQDPDGHRIELFHTHYQTIDIEDGPQRWDLSNPLRSNIWGLPAIERWFTEATEFRGLAPRPPKLAAMPPTLENYLAAEKARGR